MLFDKMQRTSEGFRFKSIYTDDVLFFTVIPMKENKLKDLLRSERE